MFDAHCHVTDIDDPLSVLARAREAGVSSLLSCGYHDQSNIAVLALRDRVPGLPIAVGLHPWYAQEPIEPVLERIQAASPTAIGECGLDGYDRDPEIPPLRLQLAAFEQQLELASRLDLPLTVHSRKAVNELIRMVEQFPKVRGVLHAYSGSYEQAEPLLARGWLIGIGGAVTRPSAARIRRMATRVSLTQIVFETDAPAIGLEGVKPPMVRPHHVLDVAQAFAALRGFELDEVVSSTDQNALRMFGNRIFERWSV